MSAQDQKTPAHVPGATHVRNFSLTPLKPPDVKVVTFSASHVRQATFMHDFHHENTLAV